MNCNEVKTAMRQGKYDPLLVELYGEKALEGQRSRYIEAVKAFEELYPARKEIAIFSAPGRTEVCGNHTDHQQGRVLAAAINLDALAVVAVHDDGVIRLKSEGYDEIILPLDDIFIHPEEFGTTLSLIRGMVAKFQDLGADVCGFDAYVTSEVLSGSGLSSSAAFEVLLGTIIDQCFNAGNAGAVMIAKLSQQVENQYFGKASGLMDQMVSSVGGFVFIDFADRENTIIEKHDCDFRQAGIQLCITDTKGSHADLTDEYVSVPAEMKEVAAFFGKECLREVPENQFFTAIQQLRESCSDRAILRAAHFYGDDKRVSQEVEALEQGDYQRFFQLIRESGNSSAKWLQNIYASKNPAEQGLSLALMLSERVLGVQGACRVHGGGFAGTIQAFVPEGMVDEYVAAMENLFGPGCCYKLTIRPQGGIRLL